MVVESDISDYEEIHMTTPDDQTLMLIDTGASKSVAGVEWLEEVGRRRRRLGLRARRVPAQATFRGPGGARRRGEEKWLIPGGIMGRPVVVEFSAVPGNMVGLWEALRHGEAADNPALARWRGPG